MSEIKIKKALEKAEKMIGKAKIRIYAYSNCYEIPKDADGISVEGSWVRIYKDREDGLREVTNFPISAIKQITIYKKGDRK